MEQPREHLGDGVYVRFDGYAFHIAVNHHDNEVVVFEPEVIDALVRFRERVTKQTKDIDGI